MKNKVLVAALQELLKSEELAEHLMGDELKKDQLEFIYSVIHHIYNSPLQPYLLSDHEVILKEVIPQVAVFKAIQQMAEVIRSTEEKDTELREIGLDLTSILADKDSSVWSQDKEVRYEGIQRKWVWEGYIRDTDKPAWEEASQLINRINLMVQEDLLDYLTFRHFITKKSTVKEIRPPFVWNHLLLNNRYVSIEERIDEEEDTTKLRETLQDKMKQRFRDYVNPSDCYIDGRVDDMINKTTHLAFSLRGHQREAWDLLVKHVTDCFRIELPDSGEEDISIDEEAKFEDHKEIV